MKFESINFFRGIAVLMVVFIHTYNFFDYNNPEYPAWFLKYVEWGQFGVQFFFLLSAFTLCNSFQYSLNKKEPDIIRNFYIKRFFRIYPLYVLMLFVFLIFRQEQFSMVYKVLNFTFLNNYYPPLGNRGIVAFSWTLNVEMSFYLLFPFIYRYLYPRTWLVLTVPAFDFLANGLKSAAVAFPSVAREIFRLRPEDIYPFFHRHLSTQISVFMLGFVLYKILFTEDGRAKTRTFYFILILLITNTIWQFLGFNLGISLYFFFLVYYGFHYQFNDRFSRIIKRIGVCSYSIYLLHFFGIELTRFLNLGHLTGDRITDCVIRYGFVLLFTWLMSEFTLKFIENPGIDFGKRFLRKRPVQL